VLGSSLITLIAVSLSADWQSAWEQSGIYHEHAANLLPF
jgi:hypothetical protein